MRAQQAQAPVNLARPALHFGRSASTFEKRSPDIPVAKTVERELPLVDHLQELPICGCPRIERSITLALLDHRLANTAYPLDQRNGSAGCRQRLQIALIGLTGNFRSSLHIG